MTREKVKTTRARSSLPMLGLATVLAVSACEGSGDNEQDQPSNVPKVTPYHPPASLKPIEGTILDIPAAEGAHDVEAYDSPTSLEGGHPPNLVDKYSIGEHVLVLCVETGRPLIINDPSNPHAQSKWYIMQTDPQIPNQWVSKEFVETVQTVPDCP